MLVIVSLDRKKPLQLTVSKGVFCLLYWHNKVHILSQLCITVDFL